MLNPYLLTESDDFSYHFFTGQDITYHIYFLDYSYMFEDYPVIAHTIYSFNIEVINGDMTSAITDERIGATIAEVFKLFFRRVEHVAVYVCDISDNRALARKRKFDSWFSKYNDGTIIKEDGLAVMGDLEIINALLIHADNSRLQETLSAFRDLNSKAGDNK